MSMTAARRTLVATLALSLVTVLVAVDIGLLIDTEHAHHELVDMWHRPHDAPDGHDHDARLEAPESHDGDCALCLWKLKRFGDDEHQRDELVVRLPALGRTLLLDAPRWGGPSSAPLSRGPPRS